MGHIEHWPLKVAIGGESRSAARCEALRLGGRLLLDQTDARDCLVDSGENPGHKIYPPWFRYRTSLSVPCLACPDGTFCFGYPCTSLVDCRKSRHVKRWLNFWTAAASCHFEHAPRSDFVVTDPVATSPEPICRLLEDPGS